MDISAKAPAYLLHIEEWKDLRIIYQGSRAVKEAGERFLPLTNGMQLDRKKDHKLGQLRYDAYKMRAIFYEYVHEAVETKIGLLHQQSANINLPPIMEVLKERATPEGEGLDLLLRRINEQQLLTGRLGLMLDLQVAADGTAQPYIALYTAETIINWDANLQQHDQGALNLVVLNETGKVRDGFQWKEVEAYRVLQLGTLDVNELEGNATYKQNVFKDGADYDESVMVEPMYMGRTLDEIPFVFVNSQDITPEPDVPPLLPLAELSLSIYRSEADYRENLHMQGQDTLVVTGDIQNQDIYGSTAESTPIRVGAGAVIHLGENGKGEYIGVSSTGLAEQRQAIEADKTKAGDLAGRLISASGTRQESGEALVTRLTAQTATLNQVALAGAAALEKILKICAKWMGANPEEVIVTPNIEFANFELKAQEFNYLMTAKQMGLPLSEESLHALLVERGYTTMTYDDELEALDEEEKKKEAATQIPGVGMPPELLPPDDNIDETGDGQNTGGQS